MRYFVSSNCLKCNVNSSNSDEGMLTLIDYRNFYIISIKTNSQIFLSPFSLVHVKTSRPQYVGWYGQKSMPGSCYSRVLHESQLEGNNCYLWPWKRNSWQVYHGNNWAQKCEILTTISETSCSKEGWDIESVWFTVRW